MKLLAHVNMSSAPACNREGESRTSASVEALTQPMFFSSFLMRYPMIIQDPKRGATSPMMPSFSLTSRWKHGKVGRLGVLKGFECN